MGRPLYRPSQDAYAPSPFWKRCEDLAKQSDWTKKEEPGLHSHIRGVEWVDTGHDKTANYRLTAYGLKGWIRGPKTWLFDLAGLDSTDSEVLRYSKYSIARDGIFRATHSSFPVANGPANSKENLEEFSKSVAFETDHGLGSPSIEDMIEASRILKQGHLQNVVPMAIR